MSAFSLVGEVWLRPGKDDALRRRHPWVYRGALARPLPQSLGPVAVFSASGDYLGVGLPSSSSGSLALRMVCFAPELWEPSTLHQRLQGAWRLRKRLRIASEAWRLLHAEGDGVPGLVADVYGCYLVFELYEPLWELYLQLLAEGAMSLTGARHVLLRRTYREGVEVVKGDLPREPVSVREHRWRLLADLAAGQKTGLFLDQRDNRWLVCRNSRGTRLLNLFAYTGGFAVAALLGGAETVLNVESSGRALALAQQTYVANGLPVREGEFLQGDAFTVCRRLAAKGEQFDWVVVDPPAFVKGPGQETRGLSGYRDVNLQALKLLRRGGMLLTCSCSARITVEQLEGALLAAALDAGREVRVLERRGAGPDHPVSLFCPETRHLKALWCAVL